MTRMPSGTETTNEQPKPSRKKSVVRGLLILLACAGALLIFRTREPRYNGRSLTSWLKQYAGAQRADANQLTEARNAIRSIGVERSLPTLLKLITAKDGAVDAWVFNMKARLGLRFLHWRFAPASQLYGLSGFEA